MRKLFPDPYLPIMNFVVPSPSDTLSSAAVRAVISSVLPIAIYGAPVRGTTPPERDESSVPSILRGTLVIVLAANLQHPFCNLPQGHN